MATKETGDRHSAGWTARYNRRGRAESADLMPRKGMGVSHGQDREAPTLSTIPADARDNASRQEYSQSLRQDADDTSVNLGTSSDYPPGVREPEPVSQKRGGASVVVSGQESCPPGEGRQSDAVQRWTRTKPEAGGIDRLLTAQKQTALALKASSEPDYRVDHRYDLLHWDRWIRGAADAVLARPGSRTEGVDGRTRNDFLNQYERQIAQLVQELKVGTYQPLPGKRVHIPKANGKTRPLGICTLRERIVQEALRMLLDPIYESDFQPYSFGFRKGRSTRDAVAVLMPLFNSSAKYYYVIEGDLKSYLDAAS